MNNDEFYNGYVTGEADAKNGAEPMVFDCQTVDFMAGYEMAYYNNKTKGLSMDKDIEQLEKIIKCATELQDYIARYNARHNVTHALYGWDNVVAQIWTIARNVRNYIEETKEKNDEL